MVRFDNPSARDYGGSHCEWIGTSACDHIFQFALDLGDRFELTLTQQHNLLDRNVLVCVSK